MYDTLPYEIYESLGRSKVNNYIYIYSYSHIKDLRTNKLKEIVERVGNMLRVDFANLMSGRD